MHKGKTVKLFYETANHSGIIHAELMNWTGYVISAPRTALINLYNKEDAKGAGIYFLISEEENRVYVGETVNGIERMRDHDYKKDFWSRVILVQTKDFNLTKTHCAYLEHRCAQIIHKESMYNLENIKKLNDYTGKLPAPDISDMETFLDNIRFILPALGVRILESASVKNGDMEEPKVEFTLTMNKGEVEGVAYIKEGQFIVRKGSKGQARFTDSVYETIKEKRQKLVDKGLIKIEGNNIIFTEDIPFTSTSTAGIFLTGYPISGPQNWKLKGTQKTYKEWEKESLS